MTEREREYGQWRVDALMEEMEVCLLLYVCVCEYGQWRVDALMEEMEVCLLLYVCVCV